MKRVILLLVIAVLSFSSCDNKTPKEEIIEDIKLVEHLYNSGKISAERKAYMLATCVNKWSKEYGKAETVKILKELNDDQLIN